MKFPQLQLPRFNKPLGICLMFHKIDKVPNETIGPLRRITLSPTLFENLIAHIASYFHPISLDELVQSIQLEKNIPPDSVVITFDDGYYDNWETAYPILKKYNVPATIFITTGFIDGLIIPIEHQIARYIQSKDKVYFNDGKQSYHWNLIDEESRWEAYETIRRSIKFSHEEKRKQLLASLGLEHTSLPESTFMNWKQISQLNKSSLITIGTHTHSHALLTTLTNKSLQSEITLSKQKLETHLGNPILYLSYPYGGTDEHVKAVAQEVGIHGAVTTHSAAIDSTLRDLMAIPRLEVNQEVANHIISSSSIQKLMKIVTPF